MKYTAVLRGDEDEKDSEMTEEPILDEVGDEYSDELDEGGEDADELVADEDDEDTYVDVPLDEVELPVQ